MGPDGETLLDAFPAAAAVLGGIGRRHGDDSTASVPCFAFEDGPKLGPAGITHALGEVVVPDQVGHRQVFQIDRVVLPHQEERRLVVEVVPLPTDLLVLLRQELHRFAAAPAALLAARHPALGLLQLPLGSAIMARILDDVALSRDEEHLQPHIDTRLPIGDWQWVHRHIDTGETPVPAIGFLGNRDGFDGAFTRAAPPDSDPSDLGEYQLVVIDGGSSAELLVGETRGAVGALQARIPWLFAILHPAEEPLEGAVQAGQHVLQDLRVDVLVLGPHRFDAGKIGALLGTDDAHAACVPGVAAFLQSGIVEFPAATQNKCHPLLLLGSRLELVLEGLADGTYRHLFVDLGRVPHAGSLAQMFAASKAKGPFIPRLKAGDEWPVFCKNWSKSS